MTPEQRAQYEDVFQRIGNATSTQGPRLTGWLVVGNGAGLTFTYNAVLQGTTCPPSLIGQTTTAFLIGLVAAFGAALFSLFSNVTILHTVGDTLLGKPQNRLERLTAPLTSLGWTSFLVAIAATAFGLSAPLRGGQGAIQACAAKALRAPVAAGTENAAGTQSANQIANQAPVGHLKH